MATIREVAQEAGVSTATVSLVLNGHPNRVGDATRLKVLAAVRKLNYRLPAADGSTESGLSHTIAIVYGNADSRLILRTPYFSEILEGIIEAAFLRGYSVTLFAEVMWNIDGNAIRRRFDGKCDGIIRMSPLLDDELIGAVSERGIPIATIGGGSSFPDCPSIDINNFAIGAKAARHLIGNGCTKFMYVGNWGNFAVSQERVEGFRSEIQNAGFKWSDAMIFDLGVALKNQLPLQDTPFLKGSGVFAFNDYTAMEYMEQMAKLGRNAPEDYQIVGVDAIEEGQTEPYFLTSFRQPLRAIGTRCVDALVDHIVTPDLQAEEIRFPAEFVPNRSSIRVHPAENFGDVPENSRPTKVIHHEKQ